MAQLDSNKFRYNIRAANLNEAIVFVGQTGMGKSYLAEALGRYGCSNSKLVLFKELTELFY